MERQEFAVLHRDRYAEWCQNVADGPYSPLDKLEFALLSAHCPMESAIVGWEQTRHHFTLEALKETLVLSGVFAPIVKAERIHNLRREFGRGDVDIPLKAPFKDWRDAAVIRGLGFCKKSFGACLIDPIKSDVVCLDTHICQIYGVNADWVYRKAVNYAAVENLIRLEAADVGLPIFAYQWAIWDWKRSQGGRGVWGNRIEDHSFLWASGRTRFQTSFKFSLGGGYNA